MKLKITSISLAFMLQVFTIAFGQQIDAGITQDQDTILIGDQVKMDIWLKAPANADIIWTSFNDTLMENVEIIEKSPPDTVIKDEWIKISQQYTLTSFEPGHYVMDAVRFQYTLPEDTLIYVVNSGSFDLLVTGMAIDTTAAIKPIKAPIEAPLTFREAFPWILVGLGIIALVVLGIYYYQKKKHKEPLFQSKPRPKLPAHILALNELEKLKSRKLWQNGKIKQYYSELTDIVRQYIEERFEIPAMEMTSYEIIEELPDDQIEENVLMRLEQTFNLANLAKFAKENPLPSDNEASYEHVKAFIEATISKPQVEETAVTESETMTNNTVNTIKNV